VLLIESQERGSLSSRATGNDKLLVLDMRTMRVTSSFDIGQDPGRGSPSTRRANLASALSVRPCYKSGIVSNVQKIAEAGSGVEDWRLRASCHNAHDSSRGLGRRTALTSRSRMFGDKRRWRIMEPKG